jgi:hypothetical protein
MKIQRLSTNGFRGLPDRSFELGDARGGSPFDLVLVTGPAGSGKTSFLDAIVAAKENVGPYGQMRPPAEYVRRGESGAKVRVDWILSEGERERSGAMASKIATESIFASAFVPAPGHDPAIVSILGEYSLDAGTGKVELFHARRRLPRGPSPRGLTAAAVPSIARGLRLMRDDAKYGGLEEFAVQASLGLDVGDPNERDGGERLAASRLAEAFSALCRTKRLDGVRRIDGGFEPRFVDGGGGQYGIDQLSDSERQAFLFAGTFVRSGVSGSLVLIDTPELHLGGADAQAFVTALTRLGVDNQLIVATNSAEVLATVPPSQVIRLEGSRA